MKQGAIWGGLVGIVAIAATTGCATSGATQAARTPALAFETPAAVVEPACSIAGAPRVVASKAAPSWGVEAQAEPTTVWVRFASGHEGRVELEMDPASLAISDEREFGFGPNAMDAMPMQGAAVASVDAHRSLHAWVEGSTYAGKSVHLVTMREDGTPIGSPIVVPAEGSAIGTPALAVMPSGRGVVAFVESNGHGFHLVAAPVECNGTPRGREP